MAVPYVLAMHEDYMSHCCGLLGEAHKMSSAMVSSLKPKSMHQRFETATGSLFTPESLLLFELLRCMRNCRIHQGGRANSEMVTARAALTPAAEAVWLVATERGAVLPVV
jgi:hypothetical protein